ncbi:hypothetical protein JCM3766R1_005960 [Sporobolomyces carnicolor]
MDDNQVVLVLRLTSVCLAASLFALGAVWPLLVHPALRETIGFSSDDRFSFWKSYQRRVSPISALILPLETVFLSLLALFSQSKPSAVVQGSALLGCVEISLFIVAAILTLAHRPFNFTFLVPRLDALAEYEKSQVAKPFHRFGGCLSPATELSEDEGDPIDCFSGSSEKTPLNGHRKSRIDTDEVIQELTNFGYGTLALSGLTFFLSLIELVCV